jgi:hypothetical protein
MSRDRWLTALRVQATVLMSLAIGQAGLAAGFLDGQAGLRPVHGAGGDLVVALGAVLLLTAAGYRRAGGPWWPAAVTGLLLLVGLGQLWSGHGGLTGLHVFTGVLYVTAATLLTSYLFRPGAAGDPGR